MKRKKFLKSIIGASAFFATPFSFSARKNVDFLNNNSEQNSKRIQGNLVGVKFAPIKKVRIGIIGLGNRGRHLAQMFLWLIEEKKVEIVALSDLKQSNIDIITRKIESHQEIRPKHYCKGQDDWKNLVERDDIDLVLIATPWKLHAPMAIHAMRQGKHTAIEVPIVTTLEDCYRIIEVAEQERKHCIMLENTCYNEEELFVLNMISNGVFGDLTHAEGGYIHDIRAQLLGDVYYPNTWRIKEHEERNGNLYATHGLGPIGLYMDIGRGDNFSHLTSMSSLELNLSNAINLFNYPETKIKCGDVNTTLIKTVLGKTIMLQFDVHTGRPYSRINKVVGTKAVFSGYPNRLYVDKETPQLKAWGLKWMENQKYDNYKSRYRHSIVSRLNALDQDYNLSHGGMDFAMIFRLISCLNQGLPLDFTIYDGVLWSSISPLSELSVAQNSESIIIPDFTGGTWNKKRDLEIMRDIVIKNK